MAANIAIQAGLYLLTLLVLAKPMGLFIARVMEGEIPGPSKIGGVAARLLYRASGIDPSEEMTWKRYALALLLFNLLGLLAVFAIQRLQFWLPLNPQHFEAVVRILPLIPR